MRKRHLRCQRELRKLRARLRLLRGVRQRDLRRQIALVSQDVYVFHGTVRENIAYGFGGNGDTAPTLEQVGSMI